jgi:hypothetical protein
MRLRGHIDLDPGRPLYAKRPFLMGGQTFEPGDRFDPRAVGADERKLRQLHNQRRIGHELPGERNGAESLPRPERWAREAAPVDVPAHEDLLDPGVTTGDGDGALAHLSHDELDALTSPALPSAGASDVVTAGGDAERASHDDVAPSPEPRTDAQAARARQRRSR